MVPKHAQNHRPIAGAASSCFPPATTSPTVPRHASILHRAVASAAAAIASRGKWCPLFHAAASPEGSGSLLSWRGGASASHHNHGGTALFASSSSELSATSGGHGRDRDGQHNNGSILPSPFSIHNIPSFAPTLLLGIATAVLYRSVLRHPNTHLTHQSVTYMLLLALQVAIQPKISQWNVLPADNKVIVALMEEVVKTSVAALLWLLQDANVRKNSLMDWSLSSSVLVAGLPAVLYAAQGVLTYTSLQRLDAVTFNGLSQLKTVSAAIFCYVILGTVQSPRQIAAIALLLASSLLFQQRPRPTTPPPRKKEGEDGASVTPGSSQPGNQRAVKVASSLTGVSACLLATAISGFAGALSQRGLQRAVRAGALHGRDPFLYCGEVSLYSALCLLVTSLVKRRWTPAQQPAPTATRERPNSIRTLSASIRSLRWSLWIPVTVKAMGGIVTVLVHKHAGSVPKGFALVLGLVLSGMLEPDSLSLPKLAGTVLVLLSSWMHFTSSS